MESSTTTSRWCWAAQLQRGVRLLARIHPQSIVHSAVECQDTAILMQTGWPDMRLPILYALSHPSRVAADLPNPRDGRNFDDWWIGDGKDGKLTFGKPDLDKYPCIRRLDELNKC